MLTLDVDGVRAFLTVADCRSFTRAAEMLGTTQAAISMKMRKLEDRLGQKLIERTPRQVRLSAQGEVFLPAAREFVAAHERAVAGLTATDRQFRLGVASHVAGPEIPALLAQLKSIAPTLTIEIQMDTARALLDAYDGGRLDAAILRSDDDRREGEILAPEEFGWFAAPDFPYHPDSPLPLAGLSPTCSVRDLTHRLLDRASIAWTEVFVGGTSAVAAALSAGVAVSPFPRRLAPADVVDVEERFRLPPLPSLSLVLHSSLSDLRTKTLLRAITGAFKGKEARPVRPVASS